MLFNHYLAEVQNKQIVLHPYHIYSFQQVN